MDDPVDEYLKLAEEASSLPWAVPPDEPSKVMDAKTATVFIPSRAPWGTAEPRTQPNARFATVSANVGPTLARAVREYDQQLQRLLEVAHEVHVRQPRSNQSRLFRNALSALGTEMTPTDRFLKESAALAALADALEKVGCPST